MKYRKGGQLFVIEVEKYETKDQILYVLDWPASSGNFHWVK